MRSKKKLLSALCAATTLGGVAVAASPVSASSHREAPYTNVDDEADNTDVYIFKDPTDPNSVNVIANWISLEQPSAGPIFPKFDDDVLYEIHLDNNGDVNDDITFQFRFRTIIDNPNLAFPSYAQAPITRPNAAPQNIRQVYSVRRVSGTSSQVLLTDAPTPPVNIGPRTTPNYEAALAEPTITALPGGGRVFAGQRDDSFFIDTGSIFDLGALRPLQPAHLIPTPAQPGRDGLANTNTHTIALQLPIASVTANGQVPTVVNNRNSVVGVWASSSRPRVRTLYDLGRRAPRSSGRFVQVSRLALPLINETLIPIGQKDRWNARPPSLDLAPDGFGPFILNPQLAQVIEVVYPGVNTPDGPRTQDIVPVLQGAGAGLTGDQLLPPADLIRVNLATPVTANPNRLGILGGDAQGFPNGRRLGDDVTDIMLRLVAGGTPFTPQFNVAPNNALTDGVDVNDRPFRTSFPYSASPLAGYDQPGRTGP